MYRRLAIIDRELEDLGLTQHKNQLMMLRRLAGRDNVTALADFVAAIEPVKEYQRYQQRPQDMLSPLTGLIDAAQADAPLARQFNRAVDDLLSGKDRSANVTKLREMLAHWQAQQTNLQDIMQNSTALVEARQSAIDFGDLNRIAGEALDSIAGGTPRSVDWGNSNTQRLGQIAKPKAAIEIMTIPGVKKLVMVASAKE
jgi:hypothetical protein